MDEIQEKTENSPVEVQETPELRHDGKMTEEEIRKYKDPNNGRFVAGNPGPPKGHRHMTSLVRDALLKIARYQDGKNVTIDGQPVSKDMVLATKVTNMALEGNEAMIKLIFNYLDGMPLVRQENTGEDGDPIVIKVIEDKINKEE